jgi:hypothetical protein
MMRLGLVLAAALFLFVCWMEPARADSLPDIGPGQAVCEEDGVRCLVCREDVEEAERDPRRSGQDHPDAAG